MSNTAKVWVSLELSVDSSWGDKTTIAQVKQQAIDDAKGMLHRSFGAGNKKIKILNRPECVRIICDTEE